MRALLLRHALNRSALTFDLALAKEQNNDNPVFYVQYGHARIASLIRRAQDRDAALVGDARAGAPLQRLTGEAELALMRRLAEFGGVVDNVARTRAPHGCPNTPATSRRTSTLFTTSRRFCRCSPPTAAWPRPGWRSPSRPKRCWPKR